RKTDRDRLLGVLGSMRALSHVVNLFVHEFARRRGRRIPPLHLLPRLLGDFRLRAMADSLVTDSGTPSRASHRSSFPSGVHATRTTSASATPCAFFRRRR